MQPKSYLKDGFFVHTLEKKNNINRLSSYLKKILKGRGLNLKEMGGKKYYRKKY